MTSIQGPFGVEAADQERDAHVVAYLIVTNILPVAVLLEPVT
jgi:hypothetical protein